MSVTKDVSLREMLESMAGEPDDAVFRWHQLAYVSDDGSIHPAETLRVTVGQARRELRIGIHGEGDPITEPCPTCATPAGVHCDCL